MLAIYLFSFFSDFVLIYPFYALMFAEAGIAPSHIGMLLVVWSITTLLLEIPSGVLADKYSRRRILFLGQMIRAAGYLCWLVFSGFWGFLVGFVCWGIQSALTSGTFQALVYDQLAKDGREQDYAKILGRARGLSYAAILAASVGAAQAIHHGYSLVLALSSLAVVVAGLAALLIPPAHRAKAATMTAFGTILRNGLGRVRADHSLARLLVVVALVLSLGWAVEEYFGIFAGLTNVSLSGVAIFMGLVSAAQAFGSWAAYRLERIKLRLVGAGLVLLGGMFGLAAALTSFASLGLLVVFSAGYAAISILLETRVQQSLPTPTRATITSLQGLMVELMAVVVYLSLGWAATWWGYGSAFQIFGWVVAGVGLVVWYQFCRLQRSARLNKI